MNTLQIDNHTFNPEILYVFSCETTDNCISKNHAHDFIEISIILSGGVTYNIDGNLYNVEAGDILLFNPGVHHHEIFESKNPIKEMHIGFRNFIIEDFKRDTFPCDSPLIKLNDFKKDFFDTCGDIIKEQQEHKWGHELIVKSLVMKLIVSIIRAINVVKSINNYPKLSFEAKEKQSIVSTIKTFMEDNYSEDISLSKISQNVYLSPIYISKIFKEELGESPINYLIKIRLAKADNLLKTSSLSIKNIAKSVGYDDAYYFSKLYKKYYGYPPSKVVKNTKKAISS